jgi:hypothetical protein
MALLNTVAFLLANDTHSCEVADRAKSRSCRSHSQGEIRLCHRTDCWRRVGRPPAWPTRWPSRNRLGIRYPALHPRGRRYVSSLIRCQCVTTGASRATCSRRPSSWTSTEHRSPQGLLRSRYEGDFVRYSVSTDIKRGRSLKALLRDDGGVHPAVLHHAMRRTEAEIVHMIGNIGPAMYDARRNDQHVTDLQLDFA